MSEKYDLILNELKKHNIRLSHQRLKVVEYLCRNEYHPTVDQIYVTLHREEPSLSKTTVYNTLHILVEAGLVRAVNIDDNETRYDIVLDTHGHFKCLKCGAIFDFTVNPKLLSPGEELNGFEIADKHVYFKGVCSKCLLNIATEKT